MVDHSDVGMNRLLNQSYPLLARFPHQGQQPQLSGVNVCQTLCDMYNQTERQRGGTGAGGTPIHVPPSAHVIFLMP